MRKFSCTCFFTVFTLAANAQFTVYESINPNIPQQSYQNGSSYPFTIYQSVTPDYRRNNIQQRQNILQKTDLKTIRGVYLNPITNEAEYIKIKVANSGRQLLAKAYYKAETDQWFSCNSQIVALGLYDDAELREYFNYKVNIPNVGTIYY